MELYQLEQLLAFNKYQTLSKAAEELLLSQPALSRSMQRLESDLGVSLFDRQKNKITLNDNGRLAVDYAQKVLEDVRQMVEGICAYDRSKHTIAIGTCAPAPLWRLSPEVAKLYPDCTITSELKNTAQVKQGLMAGDYQLIITNEPPNGTEWLCYPYCQEHLLLAVPPAHPLALYETVAFADLAEETMLLLAEIGFWQDVCAEKMPDTEFIVQYEAVAFDSLVRLSPLPAFTSDLVIATGHYPNRVTIPIRDEEANPTFYCVLAKKDKARFAELIKYLANPSTS